MPVKPANLCVASESFLHHAPSTQPLLQVGADTMLGTCPQCRRAVRVVQLKEGGAAAWASHSTQNPGAAVKPEGMRRGLRTFNITDYDAETLRQLGDDNASRGVRRAICLLRAWNAIADRTHWPRDLDARIEADLSAHLIEKRAAAQPSYVLRAPQPATGNTLDHNPDAD